MRAHPEAVYKQQTIINYGQLLSGSWTDNHQEYFFFLNRGRSWSVAASFSWKNIFRIVAAASDGAITVNQLSMIKKQIRDFLNFTKEGSQGAYDASK